MEFLIAAAVELATLSMVAAYACADFPDVDVQKEFRRDGQAILWSGTLIALLVAATHFIW